MVIKSVKISNYKCFKETSKIDFLKGFNIITGINNSGKSSLIECLTLQTNQSPHLSLSSKPFPSSPIDSTLKIDLEILVEENDIYIFDGDGHYYIDLYSNVSVDIALKLIKDILSTKSFEIKIRYSHENIRGTIIAESPTLNTLNSLGVTTESPKGSWRFHIENSRINRESIVATTLQEDVWAQSIRKLRPHIFLFKAERLNIGTCNTGVDLQLLPNASNLPQVLHNVQSNKYLFHRYNKNVSFVLPQVKDVSIHTEHNNNCSIKIWTQDPSTEREDLCRHLNDCGTGISQVLAILYVVICSKNSQVLLIDEPNSFLHPGAVKRLMHVLSQYNQHQYFITTHSPNVISAIEPATITLVTQTDQESNFEQLDIQKHEHLQKYLSELGVTLSDVFGADNILWVEGPTERDCFPIILRLLARKSLIGTNILSVVHTADFENKQAKTIVEIYSRLSKGNAILPPAVGFIFDKEFRSKRDIDEIERLGEGKIKLLPRSMYENYLLDYEAIAFILNDKDSGKDKAYVIDQVAQKIEELLQRDDHQKLYKHFPDRDGYLMIRDIHAAKLLYDIFSELTESRVEYKKTTHSVALTEWLIKNKPEHLEELKVFLLNFFPE